jgi:hypothetical protein
MIDRLKEAGIFKDAGNDVEVSELRLSSLPTLGPSGDFAWRLPRWKKEHRIAGLYETKDAQLAGWSVSSEVLAGMAIAVRAARDAKGE